MSISRILLSFPLFAAKKLQLHRKCSTLLFNISDSPVQAYLKNLMIEHENLLTKDKRTPKESKRLFEIMPIINVLEQRNNLHDNIEALSKRKTDDKDMMEMIKKEAVTYLKRMSDIDRDLQSILLEPKLTDGAVLLKVTAGPDDQEAMLFAHELFDMYESYAKYKDWDVSIDSLEKSDIGGIRKASMSVEGVGVPELMKMETGLHCVKKVPATEKDGRVHTSTVSVTVLPKPTAVEGNISDQDLVFKTKTSKSYPENTTDSAVRIKHTPTDTEVESRGDISQEKKGDIAIQRLREVLWEKEKEEQTLNNELQPQIGFSYLNDPVRTYDYSEDIVMEHRKGGGIAHNLQDFMEGDYLLEQMQNNLLRIQWRHQLMEAINQFDEKINTETADTN